MELSDIACEIIVAAKERFGEHTSLHFATDGEVQGFAVFVKEEGDEKTPIWRAKCVAADLPRLLEAVNSPTLDPECTKLAPSLFE